MSEGKRPGGLTALAVLNFIFGGFGALGALGLITIMALLNVAAAEADLDEDGRALADAWAEAGMPIFYLIVTTTALSAFLLIASGVGYIKQKIVLGRMLGNAYAILAILATVIQGASLSAEAGGGFNIGTIIGLIYPLLTLVLLNTTFKHDFTN
jgi:hypothetical protein